jgi:hypothetical protein
MVVPFFYEAEERVVGCFESHLEFGGISGIIGAKNAWSSSVTGLFIIGGI